jgi:hypothetical protein
MKEKRFFVDEPRTLKNIVEFVGLSMSKIKKSVPHASQNAKQAREV